MPGNPAAQGAEEPLGCSRLVPWNVVSSWLVIAGFQFQGSFPAQDECPSWFRWTQRNSKPTYRRLSIVNGLFRQQHSVYSRPFFFFSVLLCVSGISRGKLYVILGVCVATCGDGWLRSVKANYLLSFFSKTSPSSVYSDRAVGSVNPLEPDTTCRINHDGGGGAWLPTRMLRCIGHVDHLHVGSNLAKNAQTPPKPARV